MSIRIVDWKINSPLWLHHADHMFLTVVEIEFVYAFHFDCPLPPVHSAYHLAREWCYHRQVHDNPAKSIKNCFCFKILMQLHSKLLQNIGMLLTFLKFIYISFLRNMWICFF